jgi:hypothetical protein
MSLADAGGVVGVLLMLAAYAGAALGRLKATGGLALSLNLVGAVLMLVSLAYSFNLAAVLMESAWALVAAIGLARLALRRRP